MFSLTNSLKSFLVALFVMGGVIGPSAPASAAKHGTHRVSNCRSGVCTRVILGHDDGFEDLCVIRNFNSTAVSAYVAVSQSQYGSVGTLGPIILGVLNERKVFAWTPKWSDWRKYICQVISVQ